MLASASKTLYCHFYIQKPFEIAYLKYLLNNAQSNQKYKEDFNNIENLLAREPLYKIHVRSSLPDVLFKNVILKIVKTLTETSQWSLFLR